MQLVASQERSVLERRLHVNVPASGVRDGFHGAAHHSNVGANMDRFALINKYRVQMLAYFLEKPRATPDPPGQLYFDSDSSA